MMDFRSLNKFNVVVNAISGNFLPLTDKDTDLTFGCTAYLIFTWLVKLIYLVVTTIGLYSYAPMAEALQQGGVNTIMSLGTLILSIYLKFRRRHLCKLIQKINNLLIDSDDLKSCIRDAVEPPKQRLKIYFVVATGTVIVWAGTPLIRLLETNRFTYNDYTITAYLPGAPFTVSFFLCGILLEIIGNIYITAKKTGIDIYISYLISLLTAEYLYVHRRIVAALERNGNDEKESSVIGNLQKCVRYQYMVMDIGENLRDLLSLNIGLEYLSCILRLCILAFAFITIPSGNFEKFLCMMYAIGNIIQVYMLCSCVQELLEASTSITDDAFHEDWCGQSIAVKNLFRNMVMSNRIECRLTAFRIVDLTVPTFASILNQAYTGCLLLLRMN